ncbi:MAG: hypothetical protein J0H74_02635 [Chitinophagaceae bacterium]|nr:hypothetical protein [Chitinophagaceae bacterium]
MNKDIIYFSSKRKTVASILKMSNPGPQIPYRVTLKYFNDYLGKEVTCSINVKKSYGNKIKEGNSKIVNINYGNRFPENIYLTDFETPSIGLILFDILVIAIMLASAVISFRLLIKKNK